jgi:hypothetical protein
VCIWNYKAAGEYYHCQQFIQHDEYCDTLDNE